MKATGINATDAPQAAGGYSQAMEVVDAKRVLYISGQIPEGTDGHVPAGFEAQASLVWQNIDAQLRAANMSMSNLVQVTTYLSSRDFTLSNRDARNKALGDCKPALTVIVAEIFDESWLLEIEAIAAA